MMQQRPSLNSDQRLPEIRAEASQQLNESAEQELESVSFFQLFRFADLTDYVLMGIGSLLAVAIGAALPVAMMRFGRILANIQGPQDQVAKTRDLMIEMTFLGVGAFVAGWGMTTFWRVTGERQGVSCRKKYMQALLQQEVAWFDDSNQLEITAKFNKDLLAFQEALNDKISILIGSVSMLVTALVISFTHGWLMTMVLLACLAFICLGAVIFGYGHMSYMFNKTETINQSGALVEQSVRVIKTIKHLNGQAFEVRRYSSVIDSIVEKAFSFTAVLGLGTGLLYAGLMFKYSLGFWFGSHCLEGDHVCPSRLHGGQPYSLSDIYITFLSLHFSIFIFIQLSPAIKKILEGKVAAAYIYKVIDRVPAISSPSSPISIENFSGIFCFENVSFAYPNSKEKPVLKNLWMKIDCKSSALVGDSGCGKSTIFQLMLRFYDPVEGRVTVDGVDLRELDIKWLRRKIGYVGQEPVLFAMSLRDNLLCANPEATQDKLNQALSQSESAAFVQSLPEGLETYAGTGGREVSGGQKQRLAIARMLLRDATVVLLDQATSALDITNERLVQQTLNHVFRDKISVSIAHRISTIKNCSCIFVLDSGNITEQGRFEELQRYSSDSTTVFKQLKDDQSQRVSQRDLQQLPKNQIRRSKRKKSGCSTLKADFTQEARTEHSQMNAGAQQVGHNDQSYISRLFQFSESKKLYIFGLILAGLHGIVYPVFCIILARLNSALYNFSQNPSHKGRDEINFECLIFFILGLSQLAVVWSSSAILYRSGDQFAVQSRKQTYAKILRMPIKWLEQPSHSSSALGTLLSVDCQNIHHMMNSQIGFSVEIGVMIGGGIIISLIFDWRLGLISTALFPLILFAGASRSVFAENVRNLKDSSYKDEAHHMSEAVIFIRTVKALSAQQFFLDHQSKLLDEPMSTVFKRALVTGLLFGVAQFLLFFLIGLMFHLGALLARDHSLNMTDIITVLYIFVMVGLISGNKIMMMPDFTPTKQSVLRVLKVLDSEDEDQMQLRQQSKMLTQSAKGHIQFKNVHFSYEDRDKLFENLSFEVLPGQRIGVAGHSGSGKSTVVQLLLRFYEPDQGQIMLDDVSIKQYDLHYLRSLFGVIEQQPVLFDETVGYNVVYNAEGISDTQVLCALRQVHLAQIDSNPINVNSQNPTQSEISFLSRKVGVQGSHLSGGQKQRIAIARALIRNPSLMLLDEATSALDSDNEKKVQMALQVTTQNKTTVTVAHRISTIMTADRILLFSKGKIIQDGSYKELQDKKGAFVEFEQGLLDRQ